MATLTVSHFTVVAEGDVPDEGVAIRGKSVYKDGSLLGTLVSVEDTSEPVFVGHSFASRAIKGPSGPYEITFA